MTLIATIRHDLDLLRFARSSPVGRSAALIYARMTGGWRGWAIRSLVSCALLLFAGCTSLPERARHELPGTTLPDLIACAGQPAERMRVGDDEWVLTETPVTLSTPSVSGSVPLLGDLVKPTVSVSAQTSCRMMVRVRAGRIVSVHYVGTSSLIVGEHAACGPVVRDCLAHPDRTVLPPGYDQSEILKDVR